MVTLEEAGTYTAEELRIQVGQQDAEIVALISVKEIGDRSFVARSEGHSGRRTILIGQPGSWRHGMYCYGENYEDRARKYVETFNHA